MKIIYIAGPYSHPDPVENTHKAIKAAEELILKGYTPLIPHLNLIWHLVIPHPEKFWYDYDIELLKRCDGLVRLPGESKGADNEVKVAQELGIKIYKLEELTRQ